MSRIVVQGPLAPFEDGLRRNLAGRGYALDTIIDHIHLLADLSGWLSLQGMEAVALTTQAAEEFLRARHATGRRIGVTDRALAPMLEYLRGLQVVPQPSLPTPATFQQALLAEYQFYLERERGLAAGTVVACHEDGTTVVPRARDHLGPWSRAVC